MTPEPVAEITLPESVRMLVGGTAVLVRASRWQEINDELAARQARVQALEEALREIERVPSTAMMARVYEIVRAILAEGQR